MDNFNFTDLLYIGLGALMSFVVALLRQLKANTKWLTKIVESLTCSFLSTGCSMACHGMFGWSYEYAMPIGIFIGALGSSYVIGIASNWVEAKTESTKGK